MKTETIIITDSSNAEEKTIGIKGICLLIGALIFSQILDIPMESVL